jgi:hypothetical protein
VVFPLSVEGFCQCLMRALGADGDVLAASDVETLLFVAP